MAGSSSTTGQASLKETPTWAVATVCSIIIIISLFIEHAFHLLHKFLGRRKRKALNQALNKIKAELMVWGFVSLFLTISEQPISKICIPKSMGDNFLPCKNKDLPSDFSEATTCEEKNKISLLSLDGVNQLHVLIFALALFQVLSCVITLGLGMAKAHISEGSKFDFQKFLSRALDKDFELVVGISLWFWVFSVPFIFFSAHGFYSYFWMPFIPLIMVAAVGTKLQFIITKMCLESHNESAVVRGTLLVKPHDNLFWFGQPMLLLHLIRFILFQNSFELAFFAWTWYEFGLRSCFHKATVDIVIRMSMGILVQLLIGYVILPLYVLVTQMGSSMKKVVFTERVSKGLKNWHALARKSLASTRTNSTGPSPSTSPSHTVDTSTSNVQELEIEELETPSPDRNCATIESTKDKAAETNTNTKAPYDGEISFGWLIGSNSRSETPCMDCHHQYKSMFPVGNVNDS